MTTPRTPFAALDAYHSGEMSEADAASFEEELFGSAASELADEAAFVERVSQLGRLLLPRGGFDIGSSRARVDELIARGLRVQIIDPEPAYLMKVPKIDDDAEIVVTHFRLDLRGFDAVDVIVEKPDGTEIKTFRDVQHDPVDGSVYAVCEAPLMRISLQQRHVRSRVIGTRDGQKTTVAVFETVSSD